MEGRAWAGEANEEGKVQERKWGIPSSRKKEERYFPS